MKMHEMVIKMAFVVIEEMKIAPKICKLTGKTQISRYNFEILSH